MASIEPTNNIMDFITVYKAMSAADAEVVRSRLEAADFHPFMPDDSSAFGSDPLALGSGGVRIQVPAAEADDAVEFLKS
jgi:hypothetical protein